MKVNSRIYFAVSETRKKNYYYSYKKKTSFQEKVSTVTYELCPFKSSKVNTLHSNDKVTSTNINICAKANIIVGM